RVLGVQDIPDIQPSSARWSRGRPAAGARKKLAPRAPPLGPTYDVKVKTRERRRGSALVATLPAPPPPAVAFGAPWCLTCERGSTPPAHHGESGLLLLSMRARGSSPVQAHTRGIFGGIAVACSSVAWL